MRPNDLQPRYWGAVSDPGGVQAAYLTASVANPFYGQASAGALNTPTVQRQQLLAAYPKYTTNTSLANTSLTVQQDDVGASSYNAFQAFISFQRSPNLTATLSYTWSKLLGNIVDQTTGSFDATGTPGIQNFYVLGIEKSVLPADIPHPVVGFINYTLPFGRGQRFAANIPNWTNEMIGAGS